MGAMLKVGVVGVVLLGVWLETGTAMMCMYGGPNFSYSTNCTYSDGTVQQPTACCKKLVNGPSEYYVCPSANDECDNRRYPGDSKQGYEKEYVEICDSDNCNSASSSALALLAFLLPAFLIARH